MSNLKPSAVIMRMVFSFGT